jgi:FkbH-like protein
VKLPLRRLPELAGSVLWGRVGLRGATRVGRLPRSVGGRPHVDNAGTLTIGDRAVFGCADAPVSLCTGPGATLAIGHRAVINFGVGLEAHASVTIGDGVSIGPYCVIDDSAASTVTPPQPITIGDGCWLASRVVVMPGSTIGHGSVVTAGSVVDGDVPPRVVFGGVPARLIRHLDADAATEPHSTPHAEPLATQQATPGAILDVIDPEPSEPAYSGLVISDFTIDLLVDAARVTAADLPAVHLEAAPFGAVVPSLLDPPISGDDVAVVWTRPEAVLPAFIDADPSALTLERIHAEVDRFAGLVTTGLTRFHTVVVPTWVAAPWQRGLGPIDNRPGGRNWALTIANARLMQVLADAPSVFVVNAQSWMTGAGGGHSTRLWYSAKVPFAEHVFTAAATEIRAVCAARTSAPRKLLILDLDNTLWGGVVGDVGMEGLQLGGHDAAGEAFVDFQRALKSLQRRGVVLALASKNTESVALEAINGHDAMVLRSDDFVAWRIDWNDKAANIAAIVAELNLGMQSVVFIDDNAHERARVREALPAVLVPDWPDDPLEYVRALSSLRCFDATAITEEDRTRSQMYLAERQRTELMSEVASLDDWIRQLNVVVKVAPLGAANLSRATQLLNKTNQLNLRTRRMTDEELAAWAAQPGHHLLTISVSDRLGDAGLTGLLGISIHGDRADLDDFVLSCRVMGRLIEPAMLAVAADVARAAGATVLRATIIDTAKNQPCRTFFESTSMRRVGSDTFEADSAELRFPEALRREDVA